MKFAIFGIAVYALTQVYGAVEAGKSMVEAQSARAAQIERAMNAQ